MQLVTKEEDLPIGPKQRSVSYNTSFSLRCNVIVLANKSTLFHCFFKSIIEQLVI